jgi:hypothetical protein
MRLTIKVPRMASNNIISKSQLAREIGVSKARISQLVSAGLPVRADGKIERILALNWIKDTLSGPNGREDTGALVGAIAALGFDEMLESIPAEVPEIFYPVSNLSVVAERSAAMAGMILVAHGVANARKLVDEIAVAAFGEAAEFADHLVNDGELPEPPGGGSWSAHRWFERGRLPDGDWEDIAAAADRYTAAKAATGP